MNFRLGLGLSLVYETGGKTVMLDLKGVSITQSQSIETMGVPQIVRSKYTFNAGSRIIRL